MVGRDLGADPAPSGSGVRDGLHRSGAAEMLEVDTRGLIHRQLGVARDHRGLAHARYPADAQRRADGSLAHRTAVGQRRVLLVQAITPPHNRWYCRALRNVPALETGRPSSVNPSAPCSRSSAISVSSPPSSPRVIAARNPTGTRASRAAPSRRDRSNGAESITRVGVGHRDHHAESPGRGCPGSRLEVLLVLLSGRAQVDMWVHKRRQQVPAPALDRLDRPPGPPACPASPRAAMCPSRTSTSWRASMSVRGSSACTSRSSSSAGALGPWMSGFRRHYASRGSGTGRGT